MSLSFMFLYILQKVVIIRPIIFLFSIILTKNVRLIVILFSFLCTHKSKFKTSIAIFFDEKLRVFFPPKFESSIRPECTSHGN